MADTFSRTIGFRPASLLGRRPFQPLLKLIGGHVDRVVEVPALRQKRIRRMATSTYLMTSSLLLTMSAAVTGKLRDDCEHQVIKSL